MLDLKSFSESMKRMYLLFDRQPNVAQIDAFYDKLKFNPTECLETAEKKIAESAKRFPTIGDWVEAFKALKSERQISEGVAIIEKDDKCPNCGSPNVQFINGDLCDEAGRPAKAGSNQTFAQCLGFKDSEGEYRNPCGYREQYRTYRAKLYGRI